MSERVIVYVGGDRWDRVAGTDRRLALALGAELRVLWVDPALAIPGPELRGMPPRLSEVAPRVTRLRTLGPPLSSRPVVRDVARRVLDASVRRAVAGLGADVEAVIVASARGSFPSRVPGTRILYVTDDWLAGAELMGLDRQQLQRHLEANLARADRVLAISPYLRDLLLSRFGVRADVLPNGCDPIDAEGDAGARSEARDQRSSDRGPESPGASAALVGQLNERLDLGVLERVSDAGVPILVIGPRTERDRAVARRMDAFLARANVTWLGEVPYTEIPRHLTGARVGLTPYADSEFNRSSFPLKTLEYLASGLPVVSTDLPAVRWLDTDLVAVAATPGEFADRVVACLRAVPSNEEKRRRLAFARQHSWTARARELRAIAGH